MYQMSSMLSLSPGLFHSFKSLVFSVCVSLVNRAAADREQTTLEKTKMKVCKRINSPTVNTSQLRFWDDRTNVENTDEIPVR